SSRRAREMSCSGLLIESIEFRKREVPSPYLGYLVADSTAENAHHEATPRPEDASGSLHFIVSPPSPSPGSPSPKPRRWLLLRERRPTCIGSHPSHRGCRRKVCRRASTCPRWPPCQQKSASSTAP